MKLLNNSEQTIISTSDLIDLTERALSPDELTHLPIYPTDKKSYQKAKRLLERWEKLICTRTGNKEDFERRLASLGLNRDSALIWLQTRRSLQVEDLPDWAKTLGQILNTSVYPPNSTIQKLLANIDQENQLLFPDILHPFINYYISELTSVWSKYELYVKPKILNQIAENLLSRLSHISARTIAYDIKQKSTLGLLKGKTPQERYQYYVNQIVGTPEGLFRLLYNYPVIGRLLTTVTEQAIKNTIQWLQRLEFDYQAIASTFYSGEKPGLVESVDIGLSEPHCGGQTVWFMEFTSGLRLGYKPRSLTLDVAYLQFLTWLNQAQPELTLMAAPVLDRQDYGWVLWIETTDCQNMEQIAQYFQRLGAHLAVFYFLGGTDFHEDNFIPNGSQPIPIDLEGIGSVALTFQTDLQMLKVVPRPWQPDTVFATLMLPRWYNQGGYEQEAIAMSSLTGRKEGQIWPMPTPVYYNLGTDQLCLKFEYRAAKPCLSLPKLGGKAIDAKSFIGKVIDGFVSTYQTFINHRDSLLSNTGVITAFQNLPTRVLVRDTNFYHDLLLWSTAPDNLISGIDYDLSLEILCGTPILDENRKDALSYGRVEKKALWVRDVPYFSGLTSSCYLSSEDGARFGPINEHSGYDYIRYRLITANEVDLNWQKELIRVSLEMFFVPRGKSISLPEKNTEFASVPTLDKLLATRIYNHLLELGKNIENQVTHHSEGTSWVTLALSGNYGLPQLGHPIPWSSPGTAGTVIFMANLAAYTGNESWSKLSLEAVKTTAKMANRFLSEFALYQNGFYGLPIVIYALLVCAEKLGDESCLDLAYNLVMKIPAQMWGQVTNPDILTGSASSILALIALHRKLPDYELIKRIQLIGQGILSYQEQDGSNAGGFRIPNAPRPLLGMAHGASGIAYALSKLYSFIGDSTLLTPIHAALEYERSFYNQEHQDWPNLWKDPASPAFMSGWCGGAPGIGLARLEMLNLFGEELMSDIEASCQATLRHIGSGGHHLCCGEAGRIIFLVSASQKLNRPDLLQSAAQATENMLDFYEQKGYWKLQSMAARSIIPGLTDGIAGVGLSLLTLINPNQTSALLTLS
ncbi:type 2 lantipeptide synthetase LanM [Scytonema sp. UIC 10036]|uniref:type 2 lanthipeptide synthetase LanM family protein n=1 Tax=Scytonema sp. UIC 10036 TaxID=2304196 RepID=UPI0012DA7D7C|nr:type 2 lanthipeptide synthetase LanM family protein [Scytonema sp. UIC 10036]MUH01782.1 type 2 lantipeptide synthetase LanM [Scytonema sp. UIC 10036]